MNSNTNSDAHVLPRVDGQPARAIIGTDAGPAVRATKRAVAVQIRQQHANRSAAVAFRGADICVHAGAWAFSIFGVLSLTCAGSGYGVAAIVYGFTAMIWAAVFLISVARRNWFGKRIDAEMVRAVSAALAEGDEPGLARAA